MAKNLTTDLATTAATTNAADSNAEGVAVMEPVAAAPTTKSGKKGGKGKNRPQATGTVASVAERAAAASAEGSTEVAQAQIAVLDQVAKDDINLRNPEVPAAQRAIAKEAAIMLLVGVGLGEKSGGHGAMVRSFMIRMLKAQLGKKTVSRDDITADNLEAILLQPDFQAQAEKTLDAHVTDLSDEVTPDTIATRSKAKVAALKWIKSGLHTNYLTALRMMVQLGSIVQFGKISMPLNRALGVAFGRNITASELVRETKKAVATPAA